MVSLFSDPFATDLWKLQKIPHFALGNVCCCLVLTVPEYNACYELDKKELNMFLKFIDCANILLKLCTSSVQ